MATLRLSPPVIEWAAWQAGQTLDALAEDIVPPSRREAFLAGQMTATQAEKLAASAHIPFGLLFLPEPPQWKRESLPDLRQTQNPDPLSYEFFDVLEDVQRKVDWFADYLREVGEEPPGHVGRFPFERRPTVEDVARDITNTLRLIPRDRQNCSNAADFFSLLTERVEEAGILVFKSGIVRSQTRRGLLSVVT